MSDGSLVRKAIACQSDVNALNPFSKSCINICEYSVAPPVANCDGKLSDETKKVHGHWKTREIPNPHPARVGDSFLDPLLRGYPCQPVERLMDRR